MTLEDRQRLNVRTIRVSLNAALRSIGPQQAARCVARARQLLAHATEQAVSPRVATEIAEFQAELDEGVGQYRKEI